MNSDLDEFIAAARSFLDWIERGDLEDIKDVQLRLARLQYYVLLLSDDEPATLADVPGEDETIDNDVRTRLMGLPLDTYFMMYNPTSDKTDKPVIGSLIDDFADIARDLRKGFAALRVGSRDDAVWEWRFNYDWHWGRHAAHAQTAMWSYFAGRD